MKYVGAITTAIVSLSFLLAANMSVQSQDRAPDRAAAWNAFVQGTLEHQAGNIEQAEVHFAKALEYVPDFSEVYFFWAEQRIYHQETTRQGLQWLDKALESGIWYRTDPLDAIQLKASVMLRIGKPEEAQSLLADAAVHRMDADVALMLNLAYARQEAWSEAEKGFAQALQKFPDEKRLYIAYLQLLEQRSAKEEATTILETALSRFPGDQDLLLYEIRLTEDETLRLEKIQRYFDEGGTDPRAALLALEVDGQEYVKWGEIFLAHGGNTSLDLLIRFLSHLPEQAFGSQTFDNAETFLQRIRNYTGIRIADRNEDGYYEDRYTFEAGSLERWEWDPDQDGVADGSVRFEASRPQEIMTRGEIESHYTYGPYPYIVEVAFSASGYERTYQVAPLALPIKDLEISEEPLPSLPPFENLPSLPLESEVLQLAFHCRERSTGLPTISRELALFDGKAAESREDRNGDGIVDYVLRYVDGVPADALRDIDFDGNFDAMETWIDGKSVSTAYDSNRDSIYDFFETVTKDGTLKEWDINADGVIDLREIGFPNGSTTWEYASRLDGVFDIRRSNIDPAKDSEKR